MNLFSVVLSIRSKLRYVALALVAALLSGLMVAVPFTAQPAEAAISKSPYKSPILPDYISTHTDGSLTIYSDKKDEFYKSEPRLITVNPRGAQTNFIDYVDRDDAWNIMSIGYTAAPLGGKDGTVYVAQSKGTGSNYRLIAYRNNQVLWSYALACNDDDKPSVYAYPSWMLLGYDGSLNVGFRCDNHDYYKIVSINARTGKARFAPIDLEFDIPDRYRHIVQSAGVYPGGFVIAAGRMIKYYTERGVLSRVVRVPNNVFIESTDYAYSPKGRVYITSRDYQGVKSIVHIDPDGEIGKVSVLLQHAYVHPMPDGGFVVLDSSSGISKLYRYAVNDRLVYTIDFKKYVGDNSSGSSTAVDSKGNVVVLTDTFNPNGYNNVYVHLVKPNGKVSAIWDTKHLRKNGDVSNFTTSGSRQVIIEPGRVSVQVCMYSRSCIDNDEPVGIYSIKIPDIGYDYNESSRYKPSRAERNYVALGDSFSSGEGVAPFLRGTDTKTNRCHRSVSAYAMQLDNDPSLGLSLGGSAIERFRACSGARTEDLLKGSQGEKRQLYYVNDKTKVITMTIGGNNVEFGTFVENCLMPKRSCQEGSDAYQLTKGNIDNLLHKQLTKLYKEIQNKLTPANKSAKVYVVGYPYVVKYRPQFCQGPLLTGAERKAVEKITLMLNQKIAGAVKQLNDARFRYVDPLQKSSPFEGHDLCAKDSYFNGYSLNAPQEYTAHPNLNGQRAYARLISSAMS